MLTISAIYFSYIWNAPTKMLELQCIRIQVPLCTSYHQLSADFVKNTRRIWAYTCCHTSAYECVCVWVESNMLWHVCDWKNHSVQGNRMHKSPNCAGIIGVGTSSLLHWNAFTYEDSNCCCMPFVFLSSSRIAVQIAKAGAEMNFC